MKRISLIIIMFFSFIFITSCEIPNNELENNYFSNSYVGGVEYSENIIFYEDGTCHYSLNSIIKCYGTYEYNNDDIIKIKFEYQPLLDSTNKLLQEVEFKKNDNKIIVTDIIFNAETDVLDKYLFEFSINDEFYENEFVATLVSSIPVFDDISIYNEIGFVNNCLLISSDEEFNKYCETFSLYADKIPEKNLTSIKPLGTFDLFEIDFSKYDLLVYNTNRFLTMFSNLVSISSVAVKGEINLYGCFDYFKELQFDNEYTVIYLLVEKGMYESSDIVDKIKYNELNEDIDYIFYKPIIYLYPEEDIELTIKFENEDQLLTTYPKYNNEWKVLVRKDGTIIDESGRNYYALYFDEKNKSGCSFEEGFYVTKDNAISFLEEKLELLGFTEREANEFIMYWLPLLESNEQSIVYFEQTEERNKNCPLEFSITPNSILRTMIHIKKVDSYTQIKEQELYSFERNGFCLVEWGGTTYN